MRAGWKRSHEFFEGRSLHEEAQIGSKQSTGGKKGTLLRKLWPSPCREEPILGHPDGVGAALPGAYKYISSDHWSRPSDSRGMWGGGGHQNQLDS